MLPCYFCGWLSAARHVKTKPIPLMADSCLRHIGRRRFSLLCAAFIHELEAHACLRMTPSAPYNKAADKRLCYMGCCWAFVRRLPCYGTLCFLEYCRLPFPLRVLGIFFHLLAYTNFLRQCLCHYDIFQSCGYRCVP